MYDKDSTRRYLQALNGLFSLLATNPTVAGQASDLIVTIHQVKARTKQALDRPDRNASISISPNLKIPITDVRSICSVPGDGRMYIGGEVVIQDGVLQRQVIVVTIVFCPAEDVDQSNGIPNMSAGSAYVVRRFHFDFDGTLGKSDRPYHHLQLGGNFDGAYLTDWYDQQFRYELFKEMRLPRLPYPPTDIGIVMDTFLHQFPNPLQSIIHEAGWTKRVSEIEAIWLKAYHESALKELTKAERSRTFYRHICSDAYM